MGKIKGWKKANLISNIGWLYVSDEKRVSEPDIPVRAIAIERMGFIEPGFQVRMVEYGKQKFEKKNFKDFKDAKDWMLKFMKSHPNG